MLEKEELRRILLKHGFKEVKNYGMTWYARGEMSFRLGIDKATVKTLYIDFSIPYDDLVAMHGGTYLRIAHGGNSIRLTQSVNIVDQVAEIANTCGGMDCEEDCPYSDDECPFHGERSGHPCEWKKVTPVYKCVEDDDDDEDDNCVKPDRDITWAGRNDELYEMERYNR